MDPNTTRYMFRFGGLQTDGNLDKQIVGGKGANLADMALAGLPVPPGFTLTTIACQYYAERNAWPIGLDQQVEEGIAHLEASTGKTLGDPKNPLLVSVRSGAAVSMPGMMDTVLNLGLNDVVVEGLAAQTGNARFAFDAYRRFIDMFGDVVMGVDHEHFEEVIEALKHEVGAKQDTDLSADDLRTLVDRYKAVYRRQTGFMFPDDPREQMKFAINAVFGSWNSDRAAKYRRINQITGLIGTAVNVQAMVFGNMGDTSGTGVLFTRNPATGEPGLYGEFLINAQGEDVVAGIRTPLHLDKLNELMPAVYTQLVGLTQQLEKHYRNMQDIEFTIQEGTLYLLQTRNGKRTGKAAIRIACDLVREGLVKPFEAVRDLVEPRHLDQLLHPRFKNEGHYSNPIVARGLPASPGAAVGRVVFSADAAEEAKANGESVILVRIETSPEDVGGMDAAAGILTSRGGMTSHAAVVARGWGKPCVAGCADIVINYRTQSFTNGEVTVHAGDWVSINGATGEVLTGQEPLIEPELSGDFATFMTWVDEVRTMNVRANADTPEDAQRAREFGAEGIGLCRTEHMFFAEDRILAMREMIVAATPAERKAALDKLLPFQRQDFLGMFRAMNGLPVTVRLLDPPLHEFLPHDAQGQQAMADDLGITLKEVKAKVEHLRELNPMLGHRGCRLGVTHAEITAMQARAIFEAAVAAKHEGIEVKPEIMVPLVGTVTEFANQKRIIVETALAVFEETSTSVPYLVGTMIEVPRAALMADQLSKEAEFFSFGTNDLTQLTFGYSRDDAGTFLPYYIDQKILPEDPFQVLDIEGVGQLVTLGTERGRSSRPALKVGVCGEHGGDPTSVTFCYQAGLDYVSCSPYRVPLARLAAAQAGLKYGPRSSPKALEPIA